MLVTELLSVILVSCAYGKPVLNALNILLLFRVTDSNFAQLLKAPDPIEVTEAGIDTDANPEQPLKALAPIDVTVVGIDIEANEVQLANALSPILVTDP